MSAREEEKKRIKEGDRILAIKEKEEIKSEETQSSTIVSQLKEANLAVAKR